MHPPGPYHHGRLRAALIESASEMLEIEGLEAVTLRAVARRAQVSHNAPYHHFKNKAQLLASVATLGFRQLVESIEKAQSEFAPDDFVSRFLCVGRNYMKFALQNPAKFRLMFRPELTRAKENEELQQAEQRAFQLLLETLELGKKLGAIPETQPLEPIALFAWGEVHGLSILMIDQIIGETSLGAIPHDRIVNDMTMMIVQGLSHSAGLKLQHPALSD